MSSLLNHLTKTLVEILEALLEQGFEIPLHWTAIGDNGTTMSGVYLYDHSGELDCQTVESNIQEGGFLTPITMDFWDAAGKSAQVTINNLTDPIQIFIDDITH